MKNKFILYLAPFFILVGILIFSLFGVNSKLSWQLVDVVSDQLSLSLRSELYAEKEHALRFAMLLSENSDLVNALAEEDDEFAFLKLKHILYKINEHSGKQIRAQMITHDYNIFARSWDKENLYSGMPLDVYRKDLDEVKQYKKPRVSIEVGRKLGIKATVPIYKKNVLLGFVEVLQFFEDSTSFFQKFGIDLYVLLDDSYYQMAVLMQNDPDVANYIVANRNFDMVNLKLLQRIDFKRLHQKHALLAENKYIFYEPMHNSKAETIGAFVFVMSQKELEEFSHSSENLSFLLAFTRNNLYDIVKKESYDNKVYHSNYDKNLLSLKDTVPPEDRDLFMEEAKDILSGYTKEELLALILHYKMARRIRGKIK
ncbi:hypothetical protein JHD50_04370 [Sulfurimonas sp. MAG313]|nr:hypothetical protein [Sulfurimonas sp. MAG313]MDF1880543.1 hypothetical protein [Sulfurimonas sp. MAG313]